MLSKKSPVILSSITQVTAECLEYFVMKLINDYKSYKCPNFISFYDVRYYSIKSEYVHFHTDSEAS